MRTSRRCCFLLLLIMQTATVGAPSINPELLERRWSAWWIAPPDAAPADYGVYHFRRVFDLANVPSSFIVHVTADNRYQLYVNGTRVAWGPARGDLFHWRYETVDLAPQLRPGKNVIAAVVWNFGSLAPEAQISRRTGFLLQGDTSAERIVDTNRAWKCARNRAYRPLPVSYEEVHGYYVVGPGEEVSAALYPWGWEQIDFDDSAWSNAAELERGLPRAAWDNRTRTPWELGSSSWFLVPRSIPFMEEQPIRFARVRQATGVQAPEGFPQRGVPLRIPARSKARLLLDQSQLATAYPELVMSGGRGATITLRYAEALWLPGKDEKGHRDEVEGMEFRGNRDRFITDGGKHRLFRPLWWRTYRYVELSVETADEPLVIEDLRATHTSYPFVRRAHFSAEEMPELNRILDVGWHTVRLCAHETFMDCPYYEQLQYVGDTRVQALVALYMSGDDRLVRNALELLDASRTHEGLTMSRAPTRTPQYIPPFSLWWIGMVHDYWMYREDADFVRRLLPGVRAVLEFFAARQKSDGTLGKVLWWNFVDWTKPWAAGTPPLSDDGSSAALDLQLVLAYRWAAELEAALGTRARADEYRQREAQLRASVRAIYWDEKRALFADDPQRKSFSQQTNALAILAEVVQGDEARALMRRTLDNESLVQCSIYFRHYLHSALNKVGEGDRYIDLLEPWRWMLAQGLTTWSEVAAPTTRSDCHGWGASPNYELFRTVLGIDSAAPGFRRVLIRPFLGRLRRVAGRIPHPRGEVQVELALSAAGRLRVRVDLPRGTTGEFVWRNTRRLLTAGVSEFTI